MQWSAVTFTTPEYEHYSQPWADMIVGLGGIPIIIRVPSTGNADKNTGLKPAAILQAWGYVTTTWFVYVDIDTKLLAEPSAPDAHWSVGVVDNLVPTHKNRISAATILFRKNGDAKAFVTAWAARCKAFPGKDHGHLTRQIACAQKSPFRAGTVADATGSIDWEPNGLVGFDLVQRPSLAENHLPRVVALATFPPRIEGLLQVVKALLPQCDKMYVYLNGYLETPSRLKGLPKLHCIRAGPGSSHPDKGSQGKFHWAGLDDGYYLTVDDDIHYPCNYVEHMVAGVDRYGGQAMVGLHGGIYEMRGGVFPDGPTSVRRRLLAYDRKQDTDIPVHTLGGGVMACKARQLGLTSEVCSGPIHSGDDEDIALWAQRLEIPMIRLAAPASWVLPNAKEWIKDPLHRRPHFKENADIKLKAWTGWKLNPPK